MDWTAGDKPNCASGESRSSPSGRRQAREDLFPTGGFSMAREARRSRRILRHPCNSLATEFTDRPRRLIHPIAGIPAKMGPSVHVHEDAQAGIASSTLRDPIHSNHDMAQKTLRDTVLRRARPLRVSEHGTYARQDVERPSLLSVLPAASCGTSDRQTRLEARSAAVPGCRQALR